MPEVEISEIELPEIELPEIEMPDITPLFADTEAEETLEPFGDVDYEEELEEDGESAPATMTPWGEDSK